MGKITFANFIEQTIVRIENVVVLSDPAKKDLRFILQELALNCSEETITRAKQFFMERASEKARLQAQKDIGELLAGITIE